MKKNLIVGITLLMMVFIAIYSLNLAMSLGDSTIPTGDEDESENGNSFSTTPTGDEGGSGKPNSTPPR